MMASDPGPESRLSLVLTHHESLIRHVASFAKEVEPALARYSP